MNSITKFKSYVQNVSWRVSPRLSLAISYIHNRKRFPNFKNPKDISEIIFSEILSGKVNEYAPYVDKLNVRQFIEDQIFAWGGAA